MGYYANSSSLNVNSANVSFSVSPISDQTKNSSYHTLFQYTQTPTVHYSHSSVSRSPSRPNLNLLDISGQFPFDDDQKDARKQVSSVGGANHSATTNNTERNVPRKTPVGKVRVKASELSSIESDMLEKDTLLIHGYICKKYIATTLQGKVFYGERLSDLKQVVVKQTSKKLHELGITVTESGKKIKVEENILAEAELMKIFSRKNPPKSMCQYFDFFEDSHFYYLVMEDGGTDLFDFVVQCHTLIQEGKLSLGEWRKQCKFMFAQMVQFVRWMHETMHCANLDISLENMLIRDCQHYDAQSQTLKQCYVKFIDFGLTTFFDLKSNPDWLCQKYVGKTHYKAPKVYAKKEVFSANKADIWSLGVCLFMMIIGAPPYNKPVDQDITFQYVKHKKIPKLLNEWGRIKYLTSNLHDLLSRMLAVDESKRITMDEIVRHPWIRHYFPNDNKPKPAATPIPTATAKSAAPGAVEASTEKHDQQPAAQVAKKKMVSNVHAAGAAQPVPEEEEYDLPPKLTLAASTTLSVVLPQSTTFAAASAFPGSPSYRAEASVSEADTACSPRNATKPKINPMLPQLAASSVSGSVFSASVSARSHSHADEHGAIVGSPSPYAYARKVSSPFSPKVSSPFSPFSSSATPIMQSHTSNQHHSLYLACISDDEDAAPRKKPKLGRTSQSSRPAASFKSKRNIKYKNKSRASRKRATSDADKTDVVSVNKEKKTKNKTATKWLKLNIPLFGGGH